MIERQNQAKLLKRVEVLAKLMDGKRFFGIDPILGLTSLIPIPGIAQIGDILPVGVSLYMIATASQLGLPKRKLTKMFGWTLVDLVIGSIPYVGDLSDFAIRSHHKNWLIIKEHLQENP